MKLLEGMQVIWHGDRDWGDECFRDPNTGRLYRRATLREEPDALVSTPYGDARLRRMSRIEVSEIRPDQPGEYKHV